MYIIAGDNKLTIANHTVHRDNGVGLILRIEVERESINIGDLETIVNNIADNALTIEVYNDSDEKLHILSGFHCEPNIIAKGGKYIVEFINESENKFQIGRQQKQIEVLEKASETHDEMMTFHTDAIDDILLEVIPSIVAEVTAGVLKTLGEN
jgi:hypothetical protein